jgi:hypothetical protein
MPVGLRWNSFSTRIGGKNQLIQAKELRIIISDLISVNTGNSVWYRTKRQCTFGFFHSVFKNRIAFAPREGKGTSSTRAARACPIRQSATNGSMF